MRARIALTVLLCPLGLYGAELRFEELGRVPDEFGFGGPLAGVHDGTLIVAGGANFPNDPPWSVDGRPPGAKVWHDRTFWMRPGSKTFATGPRLPRPLAYAPSVSAPDGMYVLGGETFAESTGNVDSAKVVRLRWNADRSDLEVEDDALPPLPRACSYHAAGIVGSTIFVAASHRRDASSRLLDVAAFWSLDLSRPPGERRWVERPVWSGPPRYKMVIAVTGGRLYMIGGSTWYETEDGEQDLARYRYFDDAHVFDPDTNEWTKLTNLPRLPERRTIDTTGYEFDADRRAWVAVDGKTQPVDVGKLFDANPRASAAGSAIGDGDRVLVFSGSTGRYVTMAVRDRPTFPTEVLAYDVKRNEWSVAGRMPTALVTTNVVRWNDQFVIASGESRPGVRSPIVWSAK